MSSLVVGVFATVVAVVVVMWAAVKVRNARYERDLHFQTYRWTDDHIRAARQEAVLQSRAVVSGKVQEHLAPLFPQFLTEFDPREARFIGTPVDYVVFHGLDSGDCEIVFVEVKTGRSQLSARERLVRRAVQAGRVRWAEMRLPDQLGALVPVDGRGELPEGAGAAGN